MKNSMGNPKRKAPIMLPSYQEINKKIVLKCNDKEVPEKRPEWTKYIKEIFSDMKSTGVEEYGYGGNPAYLLDYVWGYEEKDTEWWEYPGLALAMECEWHGSEDEFWKDFVKLADIRADIKIFVGQLNTTVYENRKELIQNVKTFLSGHRHFGKDEKILIVLWDKGVSEEGESYLVQGDGTTVEVWPHLPLKI